MQIDFTKLRDDILHDLNVKTINDEVEASRNPETQALRSAISRGMSDEESEEVDHNRRLMKYAVDAVDIGLRKYHEELMSQLRDLGLQIK